MIRLLQVIGVMTLVCLAALLATPKGKLPLALRGVYKIIRRDRGLPASPAKAAQPVSAVRRFLAFLLVLFAALLALA